MFISFVFKLITSFIYIKLLFFSRVKYKEKLMEVWQICLICGAIGLLIVLLFSISTGVGNGNLTPVIKFDNTCDSNKVELPTRYSKIAEKSSYKLSNL